MVNLSDNLKTKVAEALNMAKDDISLDDLDKITVLSLSKNDIDSLKYFKNIEELVLAGFPSIDATDVDKIKSMLPYIKVLKIKEQSALIKLDLTGFTKLEKLELTYNDNLESLKGCKGLKELVFYDNKDFINSQQLVDILTVNPGCKVTLDIVYYPSIVRILQEANNSSVKVNEFTWIESVGLRKHVEHIYSQEELDNLIDMLTDIVAKYIFVTDGDIEKFGVLYSWMIHNINFVNEDDPKGEDVNLINNIYKVFNMRKGGRLSFAKAFQLLLCFAGVNSSVVYSLGALDTIGYYNGKKVYSLLGTSDYALLRVIIEGKYYYCDIAWDSLVSDYKYFDELRLLLVSKDELKIRHKFVGEGNITNSYSYHGDDSDDLIMFANDRIKNVDEMFEDINRYEEEINGAEINCSFIRKVMTDLKERIMKPDKKITHSEYTMIRQEFDNNEIDLREEEAKLIMYSNLRDGVIDSYNGFLQEHYLINSKSTKDNLLNELNNRKDTLWLSKYMYDILTSCLKVS